MKQLSILITLLVISSFALSGEVYQGLKVKDDYKILTVVVEGINENAANLTVEQVERAVKLRLLRNGIKCTSEYSIPDHFLYININIGSEGSLYGFKIELMKTSFRYGVDSTIAGRTFKPYQGGYSSLGLAGKSSIYIIEHLEQILDVFILDYLESNME